ncbi:hypothetical protein EIP86_011519 [Pleurotus ostreatoroseus]|nr:hypothetical protein EIP86_011519 [Pleurotus ostreatoroseus]
MVTLPVLHFNDVYRVQPFKASPHSTGTIDVTQWAAMLEGVRDTWPERTDGKRDGLVLFSGDVFAPSTQSSVTRGSHMGSTQGACHECNRARRVFDSTPGNHDFDFGYPHLSKLIQDTKFPWILSNIIDETTNAVPAHLNEFVVLERAGVRVGVIGLVEKEWIGTVSAWPSNFKYRDMAQVGVDLSKRLRDPHGEYKCDLIIALTHSRIPNDIALAKALSAHSPAVQDANETASKHGIDIILGGHDHLYFISKGVTSWEGYDINEVVLGAEDDKGDVLIVKSGTDFRDLSEFALELEDTSEGSVRRKLIKRISGIHHETKPGSRSSTKVAECLKDLLPTLSKALKAPLCKTAVELDCRSAIVRTIESASGNWFADVLRHAYDQALCLRGLGGADGVFICGGTIRGDSTYGPGVVTLGDVLEILPFEDPIIVLEVDGETIWAALEAGLETWPAQEGRFPIVSGFRVSWDSRRPKGQRVLGVWLVQEPSGSTSPTPFHSGTSTPAAAAVGGLLSPEGSMPSVLVDIEPVKRERGGRMYRLVTREYMAAGHDGFDVFKGKTYLVDEESGQMMSTIVRKYLLGCRFINRMSRIQSQERIELLLNTASNDIISREVARRDRFHTYLARKDPVHKWRHAMHLALRWSRAHYKDNIHLSEKEDMNAVDCFDGDTYRRGKAKAKMPEKKPKPEEPELNDTDTDGTDLDDLIVIHPVVDGRFKDEGRP